MTIYLTPAEPERHHTALAALAHEAPRRRAYRQRLSAATLTFRTVALDAAGRLLGFSEVTPTHAHQHDTPNHRRYWLDVIVAGRWRRQGIGAMLLDDALAFAWEQGAALIEAETRADERASVPFAEAYGFTVCGRHATLRSDMRAQRRPHWELPVSALPDDPLAELSLSTDTLRAEALTPAPAPRLYSLTYGAQAEQPEQPPQNVAYRLLASAAC